MKVNGVTKDIGSMQYVFCYFKGPMCIIYRDLWAWNEIENTYVCV